MYILVCTLESTMEYSHYYARCSKIYDYKTKYSKTKYNYDDFIFLSLSGLK